MRIGIGVPNAIVGTPGPAIIQWARRSEAAGFSSLASLDKVVHPGYDPLLTLAAAAAATERIGVLTDVLLAATRNPVLLAKEAASLDQLSGGRFTMGIGVGARPDDFAASGTRFGDRGRRLDQMLQLMHDAWSGRTLDGADRPVGPRPTRESGVPLLIGGMSDRSVERAVRWGIGWTAGGAGAEMVLPFAERVRQAWSAAGRTGAPYLAKLAYFSLGDEHVEASKRYILDYYGDNPYSHRLADGLPRSPGAIRELVARFEEAGFDELILFPTVADPEQVERLAGVVR